MTTNESQQSSQFVTQFVTASQEWSLQRSLQQFCNNFQSTKPIQNGFLRGTRSLPLNFRVKKPLKNNGLQGEFCSLQPLCNSVHHSSCPFLIELIPFFKVPIDIVASTANSNQPESLGATRAVQIIAAAQRIDCVTMIFAMLIIS